jgi:hypothetical protein
MKDAMSSISSPDKAAPSGASAHFHAPSSPRLSVIHQRKHPLRSVAKNIAMRRNPPSQSVAVQYDLAILRDGE